MKNTHFRFVLSNRLHQTPKDLDFYILPTLIFWRDYTCELGFANGIGISWGHWGIGFGIFKLY